ncbi:MAG: TPR repeat-containing protein YrrB [Chloroflexi bacterium ADurb.Bin180]|nr:MAG: TPR repeat-containing protein YrrB [Chloroflexi bacterium ADurb.Bin180]
MPNEFRHVQAYQHLEKGQSLESLGLLDEAMLEFKRAVEADPRIATARNALGNHYRRKGLLTKAADEFRCALHLSEDFESCFNLGGVLAELERYEEAVELYRRCIELDANDPAAQYELAYCLCGTGKYSEALQLFKTLSEAHPDDWELHFALGDCYIGLEDYPAALAELQRAVAGAPDDGEKSQVRQALLVARRHLEFAAYKAVNLKDRLYVDHGAVVLGTAGDDGLTVAADKDRAYSYADVAVTLARLLRLIRDQGWQITAACSTDESAMPLALALARVLEVPVLPVDQLTDEDFTLVIMGIGRQPELCDVTLERVPGKMISFAMAIAWPLEEDLVTDVVGVHCTGSCTLPWQRGPNRATAGAGHSALTGARRSARTSATALLRALAASADEPNESAQHEYYERHSLLRFYENASQLDKGAPERSPGTDERPQA